MGDFAVKPVAVRVGPANRWEINVYVRLRKRLKHHGTRVFGDIKLDGEAVSVGDLIDVRTPEPCYVALFYREDNTRVRSLRTVTDGQTVLVSLREGHPLRLTSVADVPAVHLAPRALGDKATRARLTRLGCFRGH